MKPHEYLRLLFSMRTMEQKQAVQMLAAMPLEERKEMQLCMLEMMRFMISEIEEEEKSSEDKNKTSNIDDDFLKSLFRKSKIE
jgi:hypothetical protein